MKKLLLLLAFVLVTTASYAQETENQEFIKQDNNTFVFNVYYPSGELKETGTLINNKKEGLCKFYDQDGNVRVITTYRNGVEDGTRKIYDEYKQLIAEISFENGLKSDITVPYQKLKDSFASKKQK